MHVKIIDPYLGGSHKQWAEEYKKYSRHVVSIEGMSAKYWKWRMQGGAIHLAKELSNKKENIDVFICSDMINLSLFKSLLPIDLRNIPLILFMHENQISYPWSADDKVKHEDKDFSYGFINYTSALIADKLWFNSAYHLESFLEGIHKFLKIMPDNRHLETVEKIRRKSIVSYIGIDFENIHSENKNENDTPVILWNHRWEYDKNPKEFFESLFELKNRNINFKLAVIGKSYGRKPLIFDQAKKELKEEIIHWGYLSSKKEYYDYLKKSDILPISSMQDFFGISIIEAIASGCFPLLPNRLAYPEHLNPAIYSGCYYEEGKLVDKLETTIKNKSYLSCTNLMQEIAKYDWRRIANNYDSQIDQML